tara:strand:- start:317 stop:700 length:384 start_codon:yes stop_codon:yes gene_type:complete
MTIKSSQELVLEALKVIKTITSEEALKLSNNDECNLIDIRDIRELERDGRIDKSQHMPRGMLEFWLDPDSPYSKNINSEKEIVLFCAGGLRSALAAKSLNEMGFKKVSHVEGGFAAMRESGFKIIQS